MEITGSPFDLDRDLKQASFSDYKGDLYVSGGFDTLVYNKPFGGGETRGSVRSVARWSSVGSELGSGPPAFEDGVVPDMMNQWLVEITLILETLLQEERAMLVWSLMESWW